MSYSATKIFYTTFLVFLISSLILYIEYDILAFGLLFMGSFIFIMIGLVARKIEGGSAFFVVIIGCIITLFIGILLTIFLENLTKQTGNKIIHALEQYYDENGEFPDSLRQLESKYLKRVPLTKNRLSEVEFYYVKKANQDYRISFTASAFMFYEYERSNGKWEYRD